MHSTGNTACGHRLQSHPGRFPTRQDCAHSTLRLGRALHHLSVTQRGFGDSLSTHPRSSHFYLSNMTPCSDILHGKLQDATDVQAHKRLGEQPGFVPLLGHMKVVQLEAQPAGLPNPTRQDYVRRLSNRRQNHEPLISNPAALGSWEEVGTSTVVDYHPFLCLRSSRIQTGLHLDRCHSCLLPTRLHRETAPASEDELRLAPRCTPESRSSMIHFFFSVGHRAIVPASKSSYHPCHHRQPSQSLSSDRHRCWSPQPLDENKS